MPLAEEQIAQQALDHFSPEDLTEWASAYQAVLTEMKQKALFYLPGGLALITLIFKY